MGNNMRTLINELPRRLSVVVNCVWSGMPQEVGKRDPEPALDFEKIYTQLVGDFELEGLPEKELEEVLLEVSKAIQKAVLCKRIGVAVIGLEVPHAHIHLIPMNRVSDMNFASPKITVSNEELEQIAQKISSEFI